MFDVRVKTLDGLTHDFVVPDDVTVIQFKEIISEMMGIAVDRQRLLYQGRVLLDGSLLNSYEVAGNVMHLVTRLPPQSRPTPDPPVEREENSDINRDQIRNILSDVLNNIGDLNNPMGVSVNNEGNRMDITVNIPTQNRLSLSRLRQNYVLRLHDQARNVLNYMEDPSRPLPASDRDRLRQADPYDIGTNDERLTEISSQPLPISNLADMIVLARSLWQSAEPQLQLWESVLRRETSPDTIPRTDLEMQRIHDSASRYVHLFSHILHILSDYLVEFQPTMTATRATAARTTAETTTTATDATTNISMDDVGVPLTNACGESGMAGNEPRNTVTTDPVTTVPTEPTTVAPDTPADIGDRSRYLYVFSEMPAQLVQVRLDVDSNIHDFGPVPPPATTTTTTTTTTTPAAVPPPRPTDSSPTTDASTNATQANPEANPRVRSQRRFQGNGNTVENILRTTIQDTIMGSNARPQMSTGSRTMRSTPQFLDNVDPYVRCQSRHFQHPSNLRSGAVISTISGIRLRETSRQRHSGANNTGPTQTSTGNSGTIPTVNVRSQSTDTDPVRSLISGLMTSMFAGPGDNPRPPPVNHQADRPAPPTPNIVSDIQRILQTFTTAGGANLNTPLIQIFPEMLSNQELDPDNFVTNQIVQMVINRLTLADLMNIVRGQYTPLNQLRIPLQDILTKHQQEAGTRESLVDHVVSDLEFFNRAYVAVFEKLRNGELTETLSEEARRSFNTRLDIFQTINNLNRYHFQSMIDMIMRSPTNQGFGQLLMNSLTLHHNESLALIDIICNNNDELRKFLIKSFLDSLMSSMTTTSTGVNATSSGQNILGLDMLFDDINSGLFRRPEQLAELRDHALNNFAVYFSENGNAATVSGNDDTVVGNLDSIEDMVTNLSENIINGAIVTELERPVIVVGGGEGGVLSPMVGMDEMVVCTAGQGEVPAAVAVNGGTGSSSSSTEYPADWAQIIARDSETDPSPPLPYSDAYVAAMPPKRRKVIVSHRPVQPSSAMMNECIDQAIKSAGLDRRALLLLPSTAADDRDLNGAFEDVVSERVHRRLCDERLNFPSDRFPTAEHNFNVRMRPEDNNNI